MKTLLIMLVLPLAFFLISGFKSISKNYLKIGSQEWALNSAIVANESYGANSKFEIDLISGSENISNAKTYIYLSITGNTTTKLAEGIYKFSSANLSHRPPFHFSGSVKINNNEVRITEGTFSIEKQKEHTDIHFILKLANGDVATGIYSGNISEINRRHSYQ